MTDKPASGSGYIHKGFKGVRIRTKVKTGFCFIGLRGTWSTVQQYNTVFSNDIRYKCHRNPATIQH